MKEDRSQEIEVRRQEIGGRSEETVGGRRDEKFGGRRQEFRR